MANVGQSRATGPLFFLKTGCPNKVLVVSGNRATTNYFGHCIKQLFFPVNVLEYKQVIQIYESCMRT